MKSTKFVFENFDEFLNFMEDKINEDKGAPEVKIDLQKSINTIVGDLKLKGNASSDTEKFFKELEVYIGKNQDLGEKINSSISSTFEILKNAQKGREILPAPQSSFLFNESGSYPYLILGTVQAKGFPDENGSDIIEKTTKIRIYDLLSRINAYNFKMMDENIKNANEQKNEKKAKEYLGSSPINSYIYLSQQSVDKRTIEFIKKKPEAAENASEVIKAPFYKIKRYSPNTGNNIEINYFDEIIKPGGSEILVKEKSYTSSGTDFFAENEVVISEQGLAALRAIISEFNNITEIKVNGSASSKNTSREGGNEKLAQDRRSAGIEALEKLKNSGVEQLKDAKITEGTATVQSGNPSESDPKMQQVSFVISGSAKKSEVVNNDPITIKQVETRRADKITIENGTLSIRIKGDITA